MNYSEIENKLQQLEKIIAAYNKGIKVLKMHVKDEEFMYALINKINEDINNFKLKISHIKENTIVSYDGDISFIDNLVNRENENEDNKDSTEWKSNNIKDVIFIEECFYKILKKRSDFSFNNHQMLIMLSFELANQKTHYKGLKNILLKEEFDEETFEADNFKRILSNMLDSNELKEFEERLENNNIFEEESSDPKPEKHVNFLRRIKLLFKKYVYRETA